MATYKMTSDGAGPTIVTGLAPANQDTSKDVYSKFNRQNFTVSGRDESGAVYTRLMTPEERKAAESFMQREKEALEAGAQRTVQQSAKLNMGVEDATYQLPGVTYRQTVDSESTGDMTFDRSASKFVQKTLDLDPPEVDTSRPIGEQVFAAPVEEISQKADKQSPVKDAPSPVVKNLALVVGIVALAMFLAM